MKSTKDIDGSLDHLFRSSYGRMVSLLMHKYGAHHVELIENAVMDAYYKALKTWPYKTRPERPQAWLYTTANNAFIDVLRKRTHQYKNLDPTKSPNIYQEDNDEVLKDPELKLLFLICHPSLSKEDQLAFMLKTLAGFGDKEISRALMVKQSTIKKRLQRARSNLKNKKVNFDWPRDEALSIRLKMVHTALYLLFNEGFYSTHSEQWIRKDLCLEAMRLCKYLADHTLANSDTFALLSLMCYHISRYESRVDEDGNIILLNDQDRKKWDPYFMRLGGFYLEKSSKYKNSKSKFQLEAVISAQHCNSSSIETTNWSLLKKMYQALYQFDRQDLVLLNLVIVNLHLDEINVAKDLFDSLHVEDFENNKSIYYMVGVELYGKMKNQFQIELLLEKAIQSSDSEKETVFLKNKLLNIKSLHKK